MVGHWLKGDGQMVNLGRQTLPPIFRPRLRENIDLAPIAQKITWDQITTPVIMLDIDGVLRNFDTAWQRAWETFTGAPPVCDPDSWDKIDQAADNAGLDRDYAHYMIFEYWGYQIMSTAPHYSGAWEVAHRLKASGWTVILASDQFTTQTRGGTRAWLADNGIPHDYLIWANNKAAIRADVYVEDKPDTLITLKATYPKSAVYRLAQPWNKHLKTDSFITGMLGGSWGTLDSIRELPGALARDLGLVLEDYDPC